MLIALQLCGPFFPSETTYLPLLGERGLYTWLLSGAWHLPSFVGLSFCCLTLCFVGGEILMFPNSFLFLSLLRLTTSLNFI